MNLNITQELYLIKTFEIQNHLHLSQIKKSMKKLLILFFINAFTHGIIFSQDVTTVEAKSTDISENLDLEAVASVFGEAEDLEDFEKKLNDTELQISNLDLNEDGEVDYIRVTEESKDNTHVVTLQATIGKDQYQDVAIISVEKDDKGETQVQVVGDVYIYGPEYIIQPVYVHPPVIWVWFWGPLYSPWRSPYYYGYYPPYYRPWSPYPPHRYHTNVHVHINVSNSYSRTTVRTSKTSVNIQNNNRRNDFGFKNPDRSYENRSKNKDVKNRDAHKPSPKPTQDNKTTTGREVNEDWKPASERSGEKSKAKENKVSTPTQKPSTSKSNVKPANTHSKTSTKATTQQKKSGAAKGVKKGGGKR